MNTKEVHSLAEWPAPEQRAKIESESRSVRLEWLRALVQELFPGEQQAELRAQIERSFHVPQWGQYHNEGVFMDRHFEEILHALDGLERGEVSAAISEADRELMQQTAIKHRDALKKYVFLHDISKADLLRVEKLPAAGAKKGEAWEGTLEQLYEEFPIPSEIRQDPEQMYAQLSSLGVKGVSYYHQGIEMPKFGRTTQQAKHGEDGKEKLEASGTAGVDRSVLVAIERHEVAYQFDAIKPDTYKKHFDDLSEDERSLALVASYIDTMASWREVGQPDLKNFLALLDSRMNFELIRSVELAIAEKKAETELDDRKIEAFLLKLRKQSVRIPQTLGELLLGALRECRPTVYNIDTLHQKLGELQSRGVLNHDELEELIQAARMKTLSQVMGKFQTRMKDIMPSLKASEM